MTLKMIQEEEASKEQRIDDYIASHSDEQPPWLVQNYRETALHVINPRMASGHVQGRVLKMITRMIKPKNILEIGTFTGYSALCFAEGLPKGGHVDTLEINDEQENFIHKMLALSPYENQITLHIGNALDLIPKLKPDYDLVFMDADKRLYQQYYDLLLPRLPHGAFILADNTLWDGKVISPPHKMDAQTRALMAFNTALKEDKRVEKVILPIRDGLTLVYKI